MTDVETFTVGVFKDVEWARRGLDALARHGFGPAVISVIAKSSPEVDALVARASGAPGDVRELKRTGTVRCVGPLVPALDGANRELESHDVAGTFRRAGFQLHDAQIYETLIARGGVLVAVNGEPRAADALAVLHAFGGGNAAIGAWHGRV